MQVVLLLFETLSTLVAYDGKTVVGTKRAVSAFTNMRNIYQDGYRKGRSIYEDRLEKYARRGFDIVFAQLSPKDKVVKMYNHAVNEVRAVIGFAPVLKESWKVNMEDNIGVYRLACLTCRERYCLLEFTCDQ